MSSLKGVVKRPINKTCIRIRTLTYIEKWLVLGVIIGIASALFAIAFYELLTLVNGIAAWILGFSRSPVEWYLRDFSILALKTNNRILILVLVILGALLSGLIVYSFEPSTEGPGVNATIRAYHRGIRFRFRVPLIKMIASSLLIGFGGSGGVQGPSLQIGAGIGSNIARILRLGVEDRRLAIVAGMAGALSAIFKSPIGAALFAIEVLYRRDVETEALVPAVISSVTAYALSTYIIGIGKLFPSISVDVHELFNPLSILTYIVLGIVSAAFAHMYIRIYNSIQSLFKSLRKHVKNAPWIIPTIGALPVATLGLLVPAALGSGSKFIANFIECSIRGCTSEFEFLGLSFALSIAVLILFKIVVTSLSVGSGGSGGLFAPSIFVGALMGYLYGVLIGSRIAPLPHYIYAYIGMASIFGAATKTPLATSFMVAEMSGSYVLAIPALVSSLLANELVGELTLYNAQIMRRIQPQIVNLPMLLEIIKGNADVRDIRVSEVMNTNYVAIKLTETIRQAVEISARTRQRFIPVVDDENRVKGSIDIADIRKVFSIHPEVPVAYVNLVIPPLVKPSDAVHDAIEHMLSTGLNYAIVVDNDEKYLGVVLAEDVAITLAHYVVASK